MSEMTSRSRAPGQEVYLKGMSRTIAMQGFTFVATFCEDKPNFDVNIDKIDGP